jgi:hypothetical protein
MNIKIKNGIYLVITIGIIIVLGFYIYKLLFWIFTTLDERVLAAIIAGFFTVLVTAISVLLTKRYEFNKQIKEQHQLKKVPIYEEFLAFWFKVLMAPKTGKKVSDKEMMIFFSEFTQKLILWGSDEVIREYGRFRDYFTKEEKSNPKVSLEMYEALLLAIRKDCGHENKGIKSHNLLKLFINDIKDYK